MNATAVRSTSARRLADVGMADAAEVGGKAASLGELIAAGARVPDGVVLTADAADMTSDERRWLLGAGAWGMGSGPFAVRSSGTAEDGAERSYAGIYESVLDVSVDELPAAVERCLASARAARVAEYEPAESGRMAVIIQQMVTPAAAGVALTADPINGDRRSCIVTAVRGVGERLVSGAALGDEWVIRGDAATARRQPSTLSIAARPSRWRRRHGASLLLARPRRTSNGPSTGMARSGSCRRGR